MTKVDERTRARPRRGVALSAEPSPRLQLGMWGTIAIFAATLAATVWLTWPTPPPETSRAHAFRDVDICVLTDARGVTVEPAKTAWANLQPVASSARVRLSYLSVSGPQTAQRAGQFLSTLVQRGCDTVVAIGPTQTAGAEAAIVAHPDVHLLTVESDAEAAAIGSRVATLIPTA